MTRIQKDSLRYEDQKVSKMTKPVQIKKIKGFSSGKTLGLSRYIKILANKVIKKS